MENLRIKIKDFTAAMIRYQSKVIITLVVILFFAGIFIVALLALY